MKCGMKPESELVGEGAPDEEAEEEDGGRNAEGEEKDERTFHFHGLRIPIGMVVVPSLRNGRFPPYRSRF